MCKLATHNERSKLYKPTLIVVVVGCVVVAFVVVVVVLGAETTNRNKPLKHNRKLHTMYMFSAINIVTQL